MSWFACSCVRLVTASSVAAPAQLRLKNKWTKPSEAFPSAYHRVYTVGSGYFLLKPKKSVFVSAYEIRQDLVTVWGLLEATTSMVTTGATNAICIGLLKLSVLVFARLMKYRPGLSQAAQGYVLESASGR